MVKPMPCCECRLKKHIFLIQCWLVQKNWPLTLRDIGIHYHLLAPLSPSFLNTCGYTIFPPKVCHCFSRAPTRNIKNHLGLDNDHIHILLAFNNVINSQKPKRSPILNPHVITLCRLLGLRCVWTLLNVPLFSACYSRKDFICHQ
jgi:hypothetical protein